MAKFVFITIPLHSHVNPLLPVAQDLVARGEEVTFYLTASFKQAVEATGARFREYDSEIEQINKAAAASGKPVGVPMYMLDESLHVIPQILESVKAEQPDCLVYETMCLSGRLLAEMLHIPAVNFRSMFAFSKRLAQIFQANASQDREGLEMFQTSMAKARALYNIKPFFIGSIFTHEESLNIVALPRAFQFDGDTFGERYRFIGSSIAPRKETVDFPFEQLQGQSVIYISHGTIYNNRPDFFNLCFAALANTPWKVVMSIGHNVDRQKLATTPDNFIVRSYVPQLEILKRASICVTHGSMMTITEAFAEGVPLVVIPQSTSDAPVNAWRVDELGLGIKLDEESLTAEALRKAITQVSNDPAYYARALEMKAEIQNAGGYKRAAELLQEFARLHI